MRIFLDIETVPAADKQPFINAAKAEFKAPSSLTKEKAGADLGLSGDDLKFKNKDSVIALWEQRFAEEKAPEVADEAWRKTALDGTKGRIISIAWKARQTPACVHIDEPANEINTLRSFIQELSSVLSAHGGGRPPFFIGHNVCFDLKFLFRRCVILGLWPGFQLPFRGRHGNDYFCTMEAWCDFNERISLANLCAALGIQSDIAMDGSQVCDYWLAGRYAEIAAYNLEDVALTEKVYSALTFSLRDEREAALKQ